MAFTDDSTKLLVAVKAYARGNALPLDNSEVYGSKAEAESYATSATAYAGQTIKVLENGKYVTYVLDPTESGSLSLTRVGVDSSVSTDLESLKTKVAVNEANIAAHSEDIAENAQGIADNKTAIEAEIARSSAADADHTARLEAIEEDYLKQADKTELTNAISAAEAAAKTHADNAVAALVDGAPETLDTLKELAEALDNNADIVDALNEAIAKKADASALTALEGTVTQNKTDLDAAILALQNRATALETADAGFTSDIEELAELIAANTQAIADEKSRAEGVEAGLQSSIDGVAGDLETALQEIETALEGKAAAADLETLKGRVTAAEQTLNSKVDTTTLNDEIAILEQAIAAKTDMASVESYVQGRLDIDASTTVKAYIDSAVGSGGTASAEAIAKAKSEAIAESKAYTDTQLSWISYNPA